MNHLMMALMGSLVLSFTLASCGGPNLQKLADEMNKNLPKNFGEDLVATKAEVTNDCFVMYTELDEKISSVAWVLQDDTGIVSAEISKAFKEVFLKDDSMKEIFQECVKEKKGFKITMKGKQSGKTIDLFHMTHEEIQKSI